MIPEVERFCLRLSEYYSPVHLMEGYIVPYTGLAVVTRGVTKPPGFGDTVLSVDIQIQSRSINFIDVYRIGGFMARYPSSNGPVSIDLGIPEPNVGGGECSVLGSLITTELYPTGFVDIATVTQVIFIKYVQGEEVLRAYPAMGITANGPD